MRFKALLFLTVSLFVLSITAEYSIVFVHLGPKLPAYTYDALAQARLFNKSCDIFLLGNEQTLNNFVEAKHLNITLISVESLKKTTTHETFISQSTLDRNFRDGFWFYASERFLYLDDFMQQYDMQHVYHLENDVMLYRDLSEIESVFLRNYPGIAATFDNDERCIPSFVYIADKNVMHELADYFVRYTKEGKNDMDILALFRRNEGRVKMDNLPIIVPSYSAKRMLRNALGNGTKHPENFSKNINEFKSVFDAAAIGQYLGGIDPRNGSSAPGFINERCIFNVSYLSYEWMCDNQGRKIPYMIFGDETYRINNLHIHCKNLKQFASI